MSSPVPSAQRSANRARVVRALRERGAQSRRALAEIGLSRSTVKSVIEELLDDGTIMEVSDADRRVGTGRPPTLVGLKGDLGVAVGIEIANGVVRAAVCDTAQQLLAHDAVPMDDHTPPAATLKTAGTLVEHMLDRLGLGKDRVLGVGVAMPGPIQRNTGVNGRATTLKPWVNVNPYATASDAFRLPLLVGNDANFAALAETTWGVARGMRDIAYIYTASGIGVGFILGGALYVGANGTAGELGHTTIDENGEVCQCGGRGCLNTLANADSITQNLWRSHRDRLSIAEVIKMAEMGDVGCRRVIADAGRHIGLASANMYNLLDPELIVLGGNLAPAGELLLAPLRESMARRAIHAGEVLPPVVVGALDEHTVVVLGAAAAVLRDTERFPLPSKKQ
ncbi:Sugar kinase of the NBD/HSP70 family, may contain an N-terminal HTH domain [Asanoa hainanensis]|uniref:Sugar kinase of the NBD/HSP70 family, may contain an N-terminal HTH domain n=1 Tax=Asanoa hainanensis TaxID=560556 RepID=A0A239NZZ1_9ACTN|nr:ROK family transcriptional regulator [Asanoa hainanensis]SNT60292.1 Sugar kinase of the NBD/HSP70 family, may contain an N-terminal HTH domain [Asanoa hainanensis]